MHNKSLAIVCSTIFWCILVENGAYGQADHFDPLEWIGADQAIVVSVDSVPALRDNVLDLEFWDHEQVRLIGEYAGSEEFKSLLKRSNVPFEFFQDGVQAAFEPLADTLLDQSFFFTVKTSSSKKSLSWMLAVPSKVDSPEEIDLLIRRVFSAEESGDSDPIFEVVNDQKFFALPASAGYWFLDRKYLFVFGSLDDASNFASRIESSTKPKRSFAGSRKYLNSVVRGQKAGLKDAEGSIRIYFDPSIATKAFPVLPEKFWNEFKLNEITGSTLQISFPQSSPESDAKLKIQVDGLVTFLVPLPGIHEAFLAASEIDELPPFPALLMDLKVASFDLERVLGPLFLSYQNTYGKESLQKILDDFGLGDCDSENLNADLSQAFDGTYVQARYLYSKEYHRGQMRALKTNDNERAVELARSVVDSFNRTMKRDVLAEAEELGGTCWFYSEAEMDFQKDAYVKAVERSTGNGNFDREKAVIYDSGYAVTEGWLFEIQKEVLEQLVEHQMSTSNESLSAMLARLSQNSDVQPIALWASWPYDWKIKIAGEIWKHEQTLRTRKNGAFDMAGFDMTLRDLKKIESIPELFSQLRIRAMMVLVDKAGKSMFTISPKEKGFRLSAGLFAPNEGE